jgi:UDP-N-acetylglucosamine acyltransferase
MPDIHPTASIDDEVQLGDQVTVGPGCVLRGPVVIGDGCDLIGQCWIEGHTTLGPGCRVFQNVAVGTEPQDWRSDPADPTRVQIGAQTLIRENVTIHRGTSAGGGVTRVGDKCVLMVGSHVGHDATLEDNVVLINNTTVAGHCLVERGAWLSGYTGLHQFTTIGRMCFTAAYTGADRDLPPFCRAESVHPVRCVGVNVVGLKRAGVDKDVIRSVREMLAAVYPTGVLGQLDREALNAWDDRDDLDEHTRYLVEFVKRSAAHRFGRYREAGRFAAAH